MIKALSKNSVRDFISSQDSEDSPTIWKIGSLTAEQRALVKDVSTEVVHDESRGDNGVVINYKANKAAYAACRLGLKGVENFLDEDGNEIVINLQSGIVSGIKGELVPVEAMNRIPSTIIQELSEQILGDSYLTEEESGN